MQTDPQRLVAQVHAYQGAINRTNAEAAAALFLETARIEEEGVQYPRVRAVLDYLVRERAHLELSDFRIQGQQVTCTYHEVNELDRVVGYAGSRRKAEFTFSQDQIATLVIHPLIHKNASMLIASSLSFSPGSRPRIRQSGPG